MASQEWSSTRQREPRDQRFRLKELKHTAARPALTPSRPVSHTSSCFSTFFKPEMVIASQGYEWLEWSISTQGIESAKAVKQDSSSPSTAAASDTSAVKPSRGKDKLTRPGQLECVLETLSQSR